MLFPVNSLNCSVSGMRLAIHAPNLGLTLPDQPFGKDVANRGLYSALANHGGFQSINFRTAENPRLDTLQQIFGEVPTAARLSTSAFSNTDVVAEAGTHFYVASPTYLSWPGRGGTGIAIRPTASLG